MSFLVSQDQNNPGTMGGGFPGAQDIQIQPDALRILAQQKLDMLDTLWVSLSHNYGKIHHAINGKIHYFNGHGFNSYFDITWGYNE